MWTVGEARGPGRKLWPRAACSSPVPISCGASRRAQGPGPLGTAAQVRGPAGRGQSLIRELEHLIAPQPIPHQNCSGNPQSSPRWPSRMTRGCSPGCSQGHLASSSRGAYSQQGTQTRGTPTPGAHVSADKFRSPHPAPQPSGPSHPPASVGSPRFRNPPCQTTSPSGSRNRNVPGYPDCKRTASLARTPTVLQPPLPSFCHSGEASRCPCERAVLLSHQALGGNAPSGRACPTHPHVQRTLLLAFTQGIYSLRLPCSPRTLCPPRA